ncbi:alpha/beta fold hydrolase [Streptomyces sp. PT12]|uniref:alpha/beta hydrolase family protein n=1 Tax=Streptomyces sp. PT12 TaxID=1510197 RepID=UPI000DE1FCD4|nr:alpha/beta fold hydrolase [Streptomyces sp. PT12]RBM07335.1 chlorophyllase [Streptomyces sp. PT12]
MPHTGYTSYTSAPVPASPVLSLAPVTLPTPGRAVDLQLRVSAPMSGGDLPIVLLSHGHGPSNFLSSLHGYGPLRDFLAARGFVVLQPTHLDSAALGLREADDPEAPLYWRSRATDMSFVLDHLDDVEEALPSLRGRVDRTRIAVVGHSMGGYTASLLLGTRGVDPTDGSPLDLTEPRVTAGVLMSAPGRGGDSLSEYAKEHYPVFLDTDFSLMRTPTLVIAGAEDVSRHLNVRGPEWYTDPYALSPGRKALLQLFGAGHALGGVSGYDAAEATDENPELADAALWLTWAFLRTELGLDEHAWDFASKALTSAPTPLGRVETR